MPGFVGFWSSWSWRTRGVSHLAFAFPRRIQTAGGVAPKNCAAKRAAAGMTFGILPDAAWAKLNFLKSRTPIVWAPCRKDWKTWFCPSRPKNGPLSFCGMKRPVARRSMIGSWLPPHSWDAWIPLTSRISDGLMSLELHFFWRPMRDQNLNPCKSYLPQLIGTYFPHLAVLPSAGPAVWFCCETLWTGSCPITLSDQIGYWKVVAFRSACLPIFPCKSSLILTLSADSRWLMLIHSYISYRMLLFMPICVGLCWFTLPCFIAFALPVLSHFFAETGPTSPGSKSIWTRCASIASRKSWGQDFVLFFPIHKFLMMDLYIYICF